MAMNLKDRIKTLGNNLPLMENREKGNTDMLIGKAITINEFGFLDGDTGKYIVFNTMEDTKNFYFGGQVLTQDFLDLEADGYREEIEKDGVSLVLETKKSKKGREYTSVKYL